MPAPSLTVNLFGRPIHSFHFFGVLGFIAGAALGCLLCSITGLSIPVILGMTLTGAATFFLLAAGAKVLTGKEVIVYYHHEIAILLICTLVLKALALPVLPYLDISLMGIATFLAFGRIGCFSVGCCHGKPFKGGVVYGHEHVLKGFTFFYEGVPLFPVQLLESIFVFGVIIAGTTLILLRLPAGTVLTVYTVIYGSFRFVIEFFRGDPDRPYCKGLSEAQWTTLLLIGISVLLAVGGILPFYWWHMILSAAIGLLALVIVLRDGPDRKWSNPRQVRKIAMALSRLREEQNRRRKDAAANPIPPVYEIGAGINLSGGRMFENGDIVHHYTLSCIHNDLLNASIVKTIATVIQQLSRHDEPFEIAGTDNGVFHVVFIRRGLPRNE